MELSERQQTLLKAITEEYIESGNPVGSQHLVEHYNLKISPATVRNEMARLTDMGYLEQPHTSAGRQPSAVGLRFYISSLMEEAELPVLQEVSLKQKIWQERFDFSKLMRQSVLALSEIAGGPAIIISSDGHLFSAGAERILDEPEFFDIDVTRAALHLIDNLNLLEKVFSKAAGGEPLSVLIGDEMGVSNLTPCGVVLSPYRTNKREGTIAVLGPARMNYAKIIPAVRYLAALLEDVGKEW